MNDIDLTDLLFFKKTMINPKGYIWRPERLRLIRDVTWVCPVNIHKEWTSKDGLLYIKDDIWTFRVPFTWNGATGVPSGKPDLTPDLPVVSDTNQPIPELWEATMVHDGGCEYIYDSTFPFSRIDVDWFFLVIMEKRKYKYSKLYYYGLIALGTSFYYLKNYTLSLFKKKKK